MEITLAQLASLTGATIVRGEAELKLTGFAALRDAEAGDLSFFANQRYINDLRITRASAVLIPVECGEEAPGSALLACANPSVAFAEVMKRFLPPPRTFRPGIHASAVVDASAQFDPDKVCAGPCAVIGAGAQIGDGSEIGAGCVIGEHVRIGRDCHLYPHVTVYDHCVLADRVRIHSGAVIGADGFGYEFSGGKHCKIEQSGIVQIDSDVEIGANTTVDRARFGRTWIKEGAKIDNLVMIAHNCIIGRHVIVVAQTGIAGSSHIGDYCILAAQVGVGGHVDIAPHITVTGQSGVTRSLTGKGVYTGTPVQLMKEHQRQQVLVRRLPELVARVKALELERAASRPEGVPAPAPGPDSTSPVPRGPHGCGPERQADF